MRQLGRSLIYTKNRTGPRLLPCGTPQETGAVFDKWAIDPMQKWLPLNYSFVRIQNSLTNIVWDNKFFTIFVSKTRLVRLI